MSSAGDLQPIGETSASIVAALETTMQGGIVIAPAPTQAGGETVIPGLGYMPTPGHLTLSISVEQRLTRYLFAR